MLKKYDDLKEEKNEIEAYYNMLNEKDKFAGKISLRNSVICVAKSIMFLTILVRNRENDHYSNAMVSDILLTMHSLTQDSLKCFYALYRSFIENYLRFILKLNCSNSMGVRELFRTVKDTYIKNNEDDLLKIFDYLEGEYGKCCIFVHSNFNANVKIQTYYREILTSDEINDIELESLLNKLETFMRKAVEFVIRVSNDEVANAFYRKNQKLKYFLNSDNFNLYMGNN